MKNGEIIIIPIINFFWIDFKKIRMRKIFCTKCKKYGEFEKLKI